MNSQISILAESADSGLNSILKQIKIVGATFNYGINKIPTVNLRINPAGLGLLCNFDLARRRDIKIKVNSTYGCLNFDGVIDGNSISQQAGGLGTSLTIKHKFVFLNEVYPRVLGMNAGSSNMFALNVP